MPDARVGDEVVIIGRQGDAEITVAEVAKRHGLGLHHVATTVGPRVTRVYLSGGVALNRRSRGADTMTMHANVIDHGSDAPTGVAFTGCHLLSATPAHAPAPGRGTATRRRDVVVNGRRVKTVDVHAHCAVPEAMALLGMKLETPALLMSQPADRLRRWTSRASTSRRSASTPTGTRPTATSRSKLIAMQNEKLAEICAAQPERFVAFASVALQHPDLAAEQLEEAVKKYGLRGAAIGGQRRRPGAGRSEVPSVLGQGRAARRPGVHPSAGAPARRASSGAGSRATAGWTT